MSQKQFFRWHSSGFTLIELLVVVTIIGILSTIVVTNLKSTRGRARDAKRMADLRQINLAMELYYDTRGAYPSYAADGCSVGGVSNCLGAYPTSIGDFISQMPRDSRNDADHYYRFKTSAGKDFCVIANNLESSSASFFTSDKGIGVAEAGATTCP